MMTPAREALARVKVEAKAMVRVGFRFEVRAWVRVGVRFKVRAWVRAGIRE
jgi:hypothetical protein